MTVEDWPGPWPPVIGLSMAVLSGIAGSGTDAPRTAGAHVSGAYTGTLD